jgi:hypothetical protein
MKHLGSLHAVDSQPTFFPAQSASTNDIIRFDANVEKPPDIVWNANNPTEIVELAGTLKTVLSH